MKLPQKSIKIKKLSNIIFIGLIIVFIILSFSKIVLNDYIVEIKKTVNYEGNLLEPDVRNILQKKFNDPVEVEFQKMKYREKIIINDPITRGEYEYNFTVKDITLKILVDWEMVENELPSITNIKESCNKNILYQR